MKNLWRNAGAYIALIVVTLLFTLIQPEFRTASNLFNVLDQSVRIGVVAVGMIAIILTGGIDLSVGSVAALAPFLACALMSGSHGGFLGSAFVGLLATLGVGALAGLTSGLAITKAYLPPIIATRGMMSVVRGLVYIFSKGTGINEGVPSAYLITGQNFISIASKTGGPAINLTRAVFLMIVVFVIGHFILVIGELCFA